LPYVTFLLWGRGPGKGLHVIVRLATAADAPAMGRVHVASWRTTYPGIVPDAALARLDAGASAARWAGRFADPEYPMGIFVAEDDAGAVIGFAGGGPGRDGVPGYAGELYALYLLREAQGRGAGRALVRAVAEWLAANGTTTLLAWVLAENHPARGFYERLGGRYVATKPYLIEGVTLDEVAYGWTDTAALRGATSGAFAGNEPSRAVLDPT